MPLSAKYFESVVVPPHDNNNDDAAAENHYEKYICKYPAQTVVCFSGVTMTPIMAVTLRPSGKCAPQPALVTRRNPPKGVGGAENGNSTQYFQGLLNSDNCEFQFVVSNLTRSNLCFHIMEAGSNDACNLVNTLHPMTTYEIPCDKRTQRAMILSAIKDAVTGAMQTMAEAEEKAEPLKKAASLEFHFVCFGEGTPNKALFAEAAPTQWMVVPGFVVPALPKPRYRGGGEPDDVILMSMGGQIERSSQQQPQQRDGYLGSSVGTSLLNPVNWFKKSPPAAADPVQSSFAARLTHGDQSIRETSQTLYGLQIDYEKPSVRMAMILSVWLDGIPPNPTTREATLQYLSEQVQLRSAKKFEALLAMIPKVYRSEECVVTMEPVDTVIAVCGHACLHHTAAQDPAKLQFKCPICRGPIMGFIPLIHVSE